MSDRDLVYGEERDSLVFLPERIANETADDLDRIRMLRTYGEARAIVTQRVWIPGIDIDEPDAPPDDDAYDAAATSECQDGDWPGSAATIALDALPEDLEDLGEERGNMTQLPWLFIDPHTEAEVLQYVRSLGYTARRDDSLFARLNQFF
jgi:hypothetical protein